MAAAAAGGDIIIHNVIPKSGVCHRKDAGNGGLS